MPIGRIWNNGDQGEYRILEAIYQNATKKQLTAFIKALTSNNKLNLHKAQEGLLSSKSVSLSYYTKLNTKVANNWYGNDGFPMWRYDSLARPREIYELNKAARLWLARMLTELPDERLENVRVNIYGQCSHPEFDIRITWPRTPTDPDVISMWVATPDNLAYPHDNPAPEIDHQVEKIKAAMTGNYAAVHAARRRSTAVPPASLIGSLLDGSVDAAKTGLDSGEKAIKIGVDEAARAVGERGATRESVVNKAIESVFGELGGKAKGQKLNQAAFRAARRTAIEANVLWNVNELASAVSERDRAITGPWADAKTIDDREQDVAAARERLLNSLRLRTGFTPDFRGTCLAVADDRHIPLTGALEITDLREILDDPREPRLDQPPSEINAPRGRPVNGVRFRWNRSPGPRSSSSSAPVAGPYVPYKP